MIKKLLPLLLSTSMFFSCAYKNIEPEIKLESTKTKTVFEVNPEIYKINPKIESVADFVFQTVEDSSKGYKGVHNLNFKFSKDTFSYTVSKEQNFQFITYTNDDDFIQFLDKERDGLLDFVWDVAHDSMYSVQSENPFKWINFQKVYEDLLEFGYKQIKLQNTTCEERLKAIKDYSQEKGVLSITELDFITPLIFRKVNIDYFSLINEFFVGSVNTISIEEDLGIVVYFDEGLDGMLDHVQKHPDTEVMDVYWDLNKTTSKFMNGDSVVIEKKTNPLEWVFHNYKYDGLIKRGYTELLEEEIKPSIYINE